MNNELVIWQNEEFKVRTVEIKGETWWVLKDVCLAVGIQNSNNVKARIDDEDKGVYSMDTLGGKQKVVIINESGLYSTILQSRKPEARKFKRWVTHDVLPSIRKTGMYVSDKRQQWLLQNKLNDELMKPTIRKHTFANIQANELVSDIFGEEQFLYKSDMNEEQKELRLRVYNFIKNILVAFDDEDFTEKELKMIIRRKVMNKFGKEIEIW